MKLPDRLWFTQQWRQVNGLLLLAVLLGLGLSAGAAIWVHRDNQAAGAQEALHVSERVRDEVSLRFEIMTGGLTALKSVYSVNRHLSRQNFATVVNELEVNFNHQGVQAFGFIKHVARRDLPAFVAAEQADGFPTFSVSQLEDKSRDDLYVVERIEPMRSNAEVLGLDAGSDPRQRAVIQLAVDSARPALSRISPLIRNTNSSELTVFVPIFSRGATLTTVAERRSALLGVLFASFSADRLLAGINETLSPGSDIHLFDTPPADSAPSMVYDADHQHRITSAQLQAQDSGFHQTSQNLTLFDRPMRLSVRSPRQAVASLGNLLPWLIALSGAAITLLMGGIYSRQVLARRQTEQKIDAVTAELGEKDNLVAGIFEMSPLAIALCDLGGNFISTNPAFEKLFGYSTEEAKKLNYWGLSMEHFHAFEMEQLESQPGFFHPHEKMFLHKDGHVIPVALNGMRLVGANDSQYICCLIEDITERKQTLNKLAESQAFSACVLDSLSARVAVLNEQGMILTVNGAWHQFDKESEASDYASHPVGSNYLAAFHGTSGSVDAISARIADGLQSVLSNQHSSFEIDYPYVSAHATQWFHMTATRLIAPATGLVISHTDISKVKQAQIEQQNAESLLLSAIDAIGEAFALFDANDRLVLCNQQYREALPLCADQMLPGNTFEQIMRAGAERGQFEQAMGDVDGWVAQRLAIHRQSASELTQRLTNGRVLRVIERQTPNGHTVGVRFDITKLIRATEAANQATRAKSEFLAIMSHEIRTPMNAVLGLLQLLAVTELNEQQSEYIQKTRQAAHSMLQLLNDILDISRLESDKTTLELQPFALDDLMRELSTLLSTQLEGKPIELLFDIDNAIPRLLIGDVLRLKQVLFNLGNNAVKFTSQGEVLVQIRVVNHNADRVVLSVSVRDTGIGIAAENQTSIFSAFSQAESSITRRFGGSGLGLSISKKLVDLMGGQIELSSVLGQGSTFSLSIPLQLQPEPVAEQDVNSSAVREAPQVLLVDDHDHARQLEFAMAQSLGWQTDVANSGAHAIALIEARTEAGAAPYQVIFMDEEMSGMDGWECSQRLRAASLSTPPLVIMLATHPRQALSKRKEAELALLAGYLVKPVTTGMLSQALTRALDGHLTMRTQARKPLSSQNKLSGLRLLVVEDNPLNQRVMQELLRNEGAVVELADNGEVGVAAIAQAKPPFDAVLMDLQMPVMDGHGATRVIRKELALTTLPVIALSANTSLSDRQACLDAGMNDHVGKPFDMRHLVNVLLTHTGRDCEAEAAPVAPPVAPEYDDNRIVLDESVLQRLGGNPAMLSELLQSYMSEIANLPDQLEALLQTGDLKGAAQLAHTLIGISAIVGTKHMAAVARQTSNKLKAGLEPAEKQPLCAVFRAAVVLTCNTLRPFMENLPASK